MAFIALLSLLLSAMAFTATPVLGNSGNVVANQDCDTWDVSVTLDNNVTSDRLVTVESDIPGYPGFEDQSFDETYGEIWSAGGDAPISGTVTLYIYYANGELEDSDSKTLVPETDCAPVCPDGDEVLTGYHYTVEGDATEYDSLSDIPSLGGSTVTVHFDIAAGCEEIELSLDSNTAAGPDWPTSLPQGDFDEDTGVFGAGSHTMTVMVPDCYHQVDFVFGGLLTAEQINTGTLYGDRNIDWVNGGEGCDEEEEPGTIIIVKDTAPDAAVDFAFTTTGAGLSPFSLDDDVDVTTSNQRTFTGLAAGAYTVTESAATGYTLSTLSCTTGGVGDTTTRTATITLVAGQTVTCTFVNTLDVVPPPATGTITIVKDTSPDAAVDFAFTTTGTGLSAFSLDDDADATMSNQRSFTGLAAGSYTVTESAATGYTLSTLSCTTGGVGDTTTRTATVTLLAGQTVTCTFVNTVQLSATLASTGGPAAAPQASLPNTAVLPEATGSTPAALGALLLLLSLGLGGYRIAEARRRR